jgi:hypothetical protein
VARASSSSFLRALPLESTLTRAESLGGTSTTDSPEPANFTARCLPSPPASSTAQRRSGNRFAQRSSDLRPERSCGKEARSRSSPLASSTAATATDVFIQPQRNCLEIQNGSRIGAPKAAKMGRRGPDRPPTPAKEVRSGGLQLFSKQFQKVNSANFASTAVSEVGEERCDKSCN